jgi:hypothetical protein
MIMFPTTIVMKNRVEIVYFPWNSRGLCRKSVKNHYLLLQSGLAVRPTIRSGSKAATDPAGAVEGLQTQ